MSWWKSFFGRSSDSQLDSELRFHIDQLTAENIAVGMSPEEARRQAALAFGGREQFKEDLRDVYRIGLLESTLANLKSAIRFIRKNPSFSLAVILTLALGIGANSAVFSAIDAILLRPLPFPDADQLMRLTQQHYLKGGNPVTVVAPVRLEDWSRLNSTFQALNGAELRVHRIVTSCPDDICSFLQVKTKDRQSIHSKARPLLHVRKLRRVGRNQARWLAEVGRLHQPKGESATTPPTYSEALKKEKVNRKSWYRYIFFDGRP